MATWLALILAAGCGGGNKCDPRCDPACPAGTICSADLHGHTSAVWIGVCLQRCTQPADCTGGLACRSFGSGAPFVCASDDVPALCPSQTSYIDDDVGDGTGCMDAHTIAVSFGSAANATRGFELHSCANGCEETRDANGVPNGARCL